MIGAVFDWLRWWRPPFLLRLCIVNTTEPDTAFRAVVWQQRGAWLVLRQAALLKSNLPPAPVDGEVVIHRSNVAFLQLL